MITISKVFSKKEYAQCMQIRTLVFVIEQGVPCIREVDEFENSSISFIVKYEDSTVGTVRWRMYNNHTAKIERMAIIKQYRNKGIGKKIIRSVIEDIQKNPDINAVKVSSQSSAISFYNNFGFVIDGKEYLDGGNIPHNDMILDLKRK